MKKLLPCLLLIALPAFADTINVTTFEDEINSDGDCSLREAIEAANGDSAQDACTPGSGADTIVLEKGAYQLSIPGEGEDNNLTGDLDIAGPLEITGRGAELTTIDGAELDRVFDMSASTVTISDLKITAGNTSASGGCVRAGGGSSLEIVNTEISDCITDSDGGGLSVVVSNATVDKSLISANEADNGGGGISVTGGGSGLTVLNSTISGNSTRGASGGGILLATGTATINSSTITDNSAAANSAVGGLSVQGGASSLGLSNTIVSGNSDNGAGAAPDIQQAGGGLLTSNGFNLIGNDNNSNYIPAGTDIVGTNASPIDADLAALADNGGPTFTHAPAQNSPAVDQGNNATPAGGVTCETTDQRGIERPIDGDGNSIARCDIGAVEYVQLSTSIFRSRKKQDGLIVESSEDSDAGGKVVSDKKLKAGDNRLDRQFVSVMSFKTSALPDDAVVLRSYVTLDLAKTVGTDPLTTHGELGMEIVSGNFGSTAALRKDDFGTVAFQDASGQIIPGSTASEYLGEIDANGLDEVNTTGLTQIRFNLEEDDNDDQGTDALVFNSGNGLVSVKPTLTVIYYVP